MIIKDIQDAKTGEKIYLAGHAEATYMSNGSTVEVKLKKQYQMVIIRLLINRFQKVLFGMTCKYG